MTLLIGLAVGMVSAGGGVASVVSTAPEDGISTPLGSQPGNPERGRALMLDTDKGNCVACHFVPDAPFPGNAGPNLVEVINFGGRSEAWLRQKIVDPKVYNPDTIMFTFHKTEGKRRVAREFDGKPVLTGQEVEDLLAYLATLKKP
ncbi:MAG: sulfur oxidation c-type cytochrome SoxX [Magnetococcales bacterium]|nr:sulfur oxidation c-type cytochrome SoxX [Magnetococcales bacterium]